MATSLVLFTPLSVGAAGKHAPVRMPDLIGRSRVDVYRIMRNNGLYFVTEGPGSSIDRWFEVTSQSPRPGVEIKWHGEASLTVTNVGFLIHTGLKTLRERLGQVPKSED